MKKDFKFTVAVVVTSFLLLLGAHAAFFDGGGGGGNPTPSNAAGALKTINLTNFPTNVNASAYSNTTVFVQIPPGRTITFWPEFFSTNAAAKSNVTFYIDPSYDTNINHCSTTHPISCTVQAQGTNRARGYFIIDKTNLVGAVGFTISVTNSSVTNTVFLTNFVYTVQNN